MNTPSSGENGSPDYASQTKENESPDNVSPPSEDETDPINVKSKNKSSWIWAYWDEAIREIKGVPRQVIVCKVIDTSDPDQTPCEKAYIKCSGSTGNAINHLRNKHDIINKDGKIIIKVC